MIAQSPLHVVDSYAPQLHMQCTWACVHKLVHRHADGCAVWPVQLRASEAGADGVA